MSSWLRSVGPCWVAWLVACGSPSAHRTPVAVPQAVRGEPGPLSPLHPYCENAAPVTACVDGRCAQAGDECVDGLCVALWDWDCEHRCRPADVPQILCHGNSAHHGVFRDGRRVRYLSALMPPELSNCGRWSWRVYDVVPDEAPRPWLDTDSLSHWFSSSYDCERGQVGRYERADLLSTAEASGWSLYLMLDVQHPRAGHGQVQPNAAAVVQP